MSGELRELLQDLRSDSDTVSRRDWNRSLPFADAIFDRWERAAILGFGKGSSIYDSAFVFGEVEVGTDTWIGPSVLLDGSAAPIRIGDGCDISAAVHIYSHDTVLRCVSKGAVSPNNGPVHIGEATYIGPKAVVVAGITIGNQSVVGANSFVNRNVPDRTVVAGTPARVVGHVIGDGPTTRIAPIET